MTLKKSIALLSAITIIVSFCGCTAEQNHNDTANTTISDKTEETAFTSTDDMFTDRDYRSTYDESTAVAIVLKDSKSSCTSQNVDISGDTVTIKSEGTYIISGELSNGQLVVDTDELSKVQLILDSVNINCNTSAAIYIKKADKVFLTLAQGTKNVLSDKEDFIKIDDNNIDSVIFSKSNLTLNGNGELNINALYGHGIVSKGDLKITSGNYEIVAANHALQGKDSIRIGGGVMNLTAEQDGVKSNNSDGDNDKGFVYIKDGELNISAGNKAIHANNYLTIKGGTINITQSNEGLESETINISGGNIAIHAEDDGMNASSSDSDSEDTQNADPFSSDSRCNINISGGTLKINADGDGIDSNGNITVTGGEIYVEGPTSDGDGALDYNGTATISGGTLVAIGSAGMGQNFSEGSTQCAMLVKISGSDGDAITVTDSSGKEILSYTANKNFNSAVISCPDIITDETYTVKSNTDETQITMTDIICGDSIMAMGGRGPMNSPDAQHRPPDSDTDRFHP